MSTPRSYQTEAIVIKKTRLGEADSIITFYTPHLGKIQGFAKSVRKPKSKLAGHLELLTCSTVSLARGRNIDTITGSQTVNSFLPLKSDLWLTSCALYAAELVNQFTPAEAEDSSLYRLLLETLERLCVPGNRELVLRYFEMHLLERVGYRPQLRECVACHQPLQPVANSFSPPAGGMLCPDCSIKQAVAVYTLSVNTQKVLRLLQGSDYATALRLKINPELSLELERLMSHYLRYLLEREVKSAAWMDSLREQRFATGPTSLP